MSETHSCAMFSGIGPAPDMVNIYEGKECRESRRGREGPNRGSGEATGEYKHF